MNKFVMISFLFVTACATKPSSSVAIEAPVGALSLESALHQAPNATWDYLKSQNKATVYEGLYGNDPAAQLPASLKGEKVTTTITKEKREQQTFLRKFRPWQFAKKNKRGQELLTEFKCENAIESQALGYSLELDFPQEEAMALSQSLHEKVVTCDVPKNESYFRLAIFSIQKGQCPKAIEYLNAFPVSEERGVNDRLTYVRSLCTEGVVSKSANPLSGYGILLQEPKKAANLTAAWYLVGTSGDPEWDRLLASFIELSEKGKSTTVRYLAGKLNYEKFRTLPIGFQTSMMVLMSQHGADLSIFQTLHRYLSEHPEMISPAVSGLLFPTRFWSEIVENSKDADPILVKALIRQESAFNPSARSRAKASGLMQLIYPTARIFGIKKQKQLLKPEDNIHAGSKFLAQLINQFGSVELALAAYNAGPGMVKQWQKRYPTDNVELFVEMIPYSETREYVRLVTRNYKIYQTILTRPPMLLGETRAPASK